MLAARAATDGAHVANFPGVAASTGEVVAAIEAAAPEVAGQHHVDADARFPFPETLEAGCSSASSARCLAHVTRPKACVGRSSTSAPSG